MGMGEARSYEIIDAQGWLSWGDGYGEFGGGGFG
jgi:hypothetical protein